MTAVDPTLPPPNPGEDIEDAVTRYQAQLRRSVKRAVKKFKRLSDQHGGGSVALANMGSRGVRLLFVAADGTFGDAIVPAAAAADDVCGTGGWDISGWDNATVARIEPSAVDRRRMAGTGR